MHTVPHTDIILRCILYTTSSVSSMNLSHQPITIHQAGPLSDLFMLRCGLTSLNLSDCKLEDEVFIDL